MDSITDAEAGRESPAGKGNAGKREMLWRGIEEGWRAASSFLYLYIRRRDIQKN